MVCERCEKKLAKVIVPDKWKEGASNTTEGGGRKINKNKLLSEKKKEFVLCAVSKYLTPSFINKGMYRSTQMLSGTSGLSVMADRLGAASRLKR